jgi:ferrochelatase
MGDAIMSKVAILLMAHGGPDSLDDIEPFLGYIMGGHGAQPSPEIIAAVKSRYQLIGGRSPLLEITTQQAAALEKELNKKTDRFSVYVGMRHWSPFIKDTLREIIMDKPEYLVAISMAPQYSKMSVGAYIEAAQKALLSEGGGDIPATFVRHWHNQPLLLDAFSKKVKEGLLAYPEADRADLFILFTAHSLPESIRADHDPYPTHLQETVDGVVKRLGSLVSPDQWRFAYQSQGMRGGVWLGPPVEEIFSAIEAAGRWKKILVAPIGFIADHVEILYDIDILYKGIAEKKGIQLRRTESLNVTPLFIQALAATVHTHLPIE